MAHSATAIRSLCKISPKAESIPSSNSKRRRNIIFRTIVLKRYRSLEPAVQIKLQYGICNDRAKQQSQPARLSPTIELMEA